MHKCLVLAAYDQSDHRSVRSQWATCKLIDTDQVHHSVLSSGDQTVHSGQTCSLQCSTGNMQSAVFGSAAGDQIMITVGNTQSAVFSSY
jgi:hypothetical protein